MPDMDGTSARYDLIADFYDGVVGSKVIDSATAALLELAGDVLGLRLLDLACGQGRVARELARGGANVVGVDMSCALLDRARTAEDQEPLGITYREVDASAAGALAGEVFDGVTCNHGLADIDDLEGALATAARVLRAGGWFVFSILHPCFPGWGVSAPSSWPPGGGYYEERWWLARNVGIRGKVGSNHRMLSTYVNALVRHRLGIEEIAEPRPDADLRARQVSEKPDADPAPMFLAARCRRV